MKRLLKVSLVLAVSCLLISPAWAVNTITRTGRTINILFDGATAVDFATNATINLPNGAYFDRVELKAAAANDTVTLRETTSAGAATVYFKSIDGGPQNMYLSKEFHKFYIVGSEATSGATLILRIAE